MVKRKITKTKRVARRVDSLFRVLYPEGMTNNAYTMRENILGCGVLNDRKKLRYYIKTYKNPFQKAGFAVLSRATRIYLLNNI